jgi:hypothetical protein
MILKEKKEQKELAGIIYTPVDTVEVSQYGLGAWSFSKLKMLNKCPFQFYLKYVVKAKTIVPPPVSIITETGKAAHRILELTVMGKSVEDAFRLVKKEFAEVLPGDLWDNGDGSHEAGGVGRSEYSITKFMERLDAFEKRHPVKRYITELKIGVTKDWYPTGFFTNDPEAPEKDVYIRGVIDLIIQLQSGDVVFIDHKNGPDPAFGVKNYQNQLDWYKVMFSKGVEPYGNAQSGVHFVRAGEVVMGSLTEKVDVETKLHNRVEFEIRGAVDKVKELGFFKHIAGSACTYCEFKDICKSGALKSLEADTKKYFPILPI